MFKTSGTTGKNNFLKAIALILALTFIVSGNISLAQNALTDELKLRGVNISVPSPLPSSFSSAAVSLRGQGTDLSGFAFAAVYVLERAASKAGIRQSFSENHMRYALSSDSGNALGFNRTYNEGGSRRMVTAYLMRNELTGPVLASDDPYSYGDSFARALSETSSKTPAGRVGGVIYIPDSLQDKSNVEYIKYAVQEYGAVAGAVYYSEEFLNDNLYYYTGNEQPNHAIAITGWDDTEGSFRVRDSEGENGRSYSLSYETPVFDAYAISSYSTIRYDATYERDTLAQSSTIGFGGDTAYFANIFTIENDGEVLNSISFFASGENSLAQFYLIPDIEGTITSLPTALTLNGGERSIRFDMPGYYTVNLDGVIPVGAKGGSFAVAAKVTTPYKSEPIPLQAVSGGTEGVSFVSGDGMSWIDSVANNGSYVCLKAHTSTDVSIPLEGIEINIPEAEEHNYDGDTLHMSTGSVIKLEEKLIPGSASNTGAVTYSIKNPGEFDFTVPNTNIPPAETDVVRLENSTGKLTALREGEAEVRVTVSASAVTGTLSSPGGVFEDTIKIMVSDVSPVEITLDQNEVTLTTDDTLTLNATILPEDTTDKRVFWSVAADTWGVPFPLPVDLNDPYNESRPPAVVTDGKVTFLRPGECYIFAKTFDGGAEAVCRVIIEEIKPVSISVNRRSITMARGTEYTLFAVYRPSNTSYQDSTWYSDNESVAIVDSRGIVRALSAGSANIWVNDRYGNNALCAVTVENGPSAVVSVGKSVTLQIRGVFDKNVDFLWEESSYSGSPGSFNIQPLSSGKIRVSPLSEGGTVITIIANKNIGTEEEPVNTLVGRQSFIVEGVNPLRRLALSDESGEIVKKIVLCYDPNGIIPPETAKIKASVLAPENATELGYEWHARNENIVSVNGMGTEALISPKSSGTTNVNAINYNNNRRVSVSVTVKPYPSAIELRSKSYVRLQTGKTSSLRTKVIGGDSKQIEYTIRDSGFNENEHTEEDPIVSIDEKGRITALRGGVVNITAAARPYTEDAPSVTVTVESIDAVRSIELLTETNELKPGEAALLTVIWNPREPANGSVKYIISDPEVAEINFYSSGTSIRALSPGKVQITALTADGKKRSTVNITVNS